MFAMRMCANAILNASVSGNGSDGGRMNEAQ